MDHALKTALPAAAAAALPNLASAATPQDLQKILRAIADEMERNRATARDALLELLESIERSLSIPLDVFGAAIAAPNTKKTRDPVVLEKVTPGAQGAVDVLTRAVEKAHGFLLDVFTSVKACTLGQTNVPRSFTIAADISSEMASRLKDMSQFLLHELAAPGVTQKNSLHIGGISLGIFERFPRNWPFFGNEGGTQQTERFLNDTQDPSSRLILSLLPYFPPEGKSVKIGSDYLTSSFKEKTNEKTKQKQIALQVTISSTDPNPPSSNITS